MVENKTFAMYGIKIDKVPDNFKVENSRLTSVSAIRQYAEHLRKVRKSMRDTYSIWVGSTMVMADPFKGGDLDYQVGGVAIYIGTNIKHARIDELGNAILNVNMNPFLHKLEGERRVYTGISWFDVDK